MAKIPQPIIDQILDRTDIVDVVSNYVTLTRRGQNFFGICPFHKEKTGSFSVHPERQMFKCFGCGKGGTALTFIQSVENLSFFEAVRFLAEKAGVRVEFDDTNRRGSQGSADVDRTQVLEMAANQFAHWLTNSREAFDYLAKRGIDQKTAQRFRLGFAPDSWEAIHTHLSRNGISAKIQEELGLVLPRKDGQGCYDRFRNRIIFPIANPLGKIVAFGGRIIGEGEPKYLNSPETPLFNKSRTLYLLEKAREPIRRIGKTLVVEGYMDAIALHRFGYEYCVASLGTALTENHARLLRRYGENIYLIYDGDEAGLAAARRGVEIFLSTGLPIRVVVVPPGEDPDSILSREGKEPMDRLIEEARDGFHFCFDRAANEHGTDTVGARRALTRSLIPMLLRIPEAVVQSEYITFLSNKMGVDQAAIRHDMARFRQPQSRPEKPEQPGTLYTVRTEDLNPAERAKLHLITALLNSLGFVSSASGESLNPDSGSDPLHAEERERINQVVDLIPDRPEYPFSALIQKLLSIKPKTYKNMASLLEGAFSGDARSQTILNAAPDEAPIGTDRNKMLFDAAHILQDMHTKQKHRTLTGSMRQSAGEIQNGGLEEAREFLRQLDSLHGLGEKKKS